MISAVTEVEQVAVDPWLDPAGPPDPAVVRASTGAGAVCWEALLDRVTEMGARTRWRWDGPRSGWVLAAVRAGRPFLTLMPREGGCGALVILGRAQVAEAGSLPLGEHVGAVFREARQYPDGRWLFITVHTERDVADVVALLATKLPATIRARLAAGRTSAGKG